MPSTTSCEMVYATIIVGDVMSEPFNPTQEEDWASSPSAGACDVCDSRKKCGSGICLLATLRKFEGE